MSDNVSDERLMELATEALTNSYCPYSNFPVGAALLSKSGKVYKGVNVENAAYPAGICAERSAFVAAITDGEREFKSIAVTTKCQDPASPCGVCRQFMAEFGIDIRIIMFSSDKRIIKPLSELLPNAFTPSSLKKVNL